MNPRQQAAFLYEWSRRRRGGLGRIVLLGAGIGALGGLAFASLMLYAMTANGGTFSVAEDQMGGFLVLLSRALGPTGFLFVLSIVMFGGLGAGLAFIIGRRMEGTYQHLLSHGASVPETKPEFTWKDRAPSFVVLGVFMLLLIWLVSMLIWEINRGAS